MFEQCFSRCLLRFKIFYNKYCAHYNTFNNNDNENSISENWVRLKERKPIEKQSLVQSIEIKVT